MNGWFYNLYFKFISQQTIISLLKERNQKGLSELYDKYSPTLLGLINNIIQDIPTSEEILQKTFLKIWNNIDQYDESKSTFFTWMAAIARNTAIDKARLKGFQRNKKTESIDSNVYSANVVHTNSENIDVERLTSKLDKKYKDVIDLLYLKGYTQKEASEALEIPLGTIKTRLRSAINLLREELKDEKKFFLGMLCLLLMLILLLT